MKKLDPAKDKESVKKTVEIFSKIEAVAPAEVKPQWGRVVKAVSLMLTIDEEALKKDPSKALDVLAQIDLSGLQSDFEVITKHAGSACGVAF